MTAAIEKWTFTVYPKAVDCINGHIGNPELSFHNELQDDRYMLMVVKRCDHCDIPLESEPADLENCKRFYAGEAPIAQ